MTTTVSDPRMQIGAFRRQNKRPVLPALDRVFWIVAGSFTKCGSLACAGCAKFGSKQVLIDL